MASRLDILFCIYNVLTVFELIVKPHKKPIIIAEVEFLFTLNTLDIMFPNIRDRISIILVCKITSVKNINGNRDGSTLVIKIITLSFTDSKFCFDSISNISNVIINSINFIIFFMLYVLYNFILTPNRFYE